MILTLWKMVARKDKNHKHKVALHCWRWSAHHFCRPRKLLAGFSSEHVYNEFSSWVALTLFLLSSEWLKMFEFSSEFHSLSRTLHWKMMLSVLGAELSLSFVLFFFHLYVFHRKEIDLKAFFLLNFYYIWGGGVYLCPLGHLGSKKRWCVDFILKPFSLIPMPPTSLPLNHVPWPMT